MAFVAFALVSSTTYAQNADSETTQRDGFIFEFVVGEALSVQKIVLVFKPSTKHKEPSFSRFKVWTHVKRKLAITLSLPGNIYEFQDNDRNFGGVIPSLQYWVKDRWWIHGGIGLAIDSPALYDIKDEVNDDWNFGCAVMASTGYEFYKRKISRLMFSLNWFLVVRLQMEMHTEMHSSLMQDQGLAGYRFKRNSDFPYSLFL